MTGERRFGQPVYAATDASRDAALLKAVADTLGFLLVPLPGGALGGILAERTGRSAKEFGDVMIRIGEALRDGHLAPAEGRAILTEIREVMLELAALAEAVKAAVDMPRSAPTGGETA